MKKPGRMSAGLTVPLRVAGGGASHNQRVPGGLGTKSGGGGLPGMRIAPRSGTGTVLFGHQGRDELAFTLILSRREYESTVVRDAPRLGPHGRINVGGSHLQHLRQRK